MAFVGDYRSADQAKQRKNARLKDQFDRWWGTTIELKTGDPCAEVAPFGGWADPLKTPNVYLRVPKFEDGQPMPGRIEVDFDAWIADIQSASDDWYAAIDVMGNAKFPFASSDERDKWPENPHLTQEAGKRPWPTVEMLERARNGDKGLLGQLSTLEQIDANNDPDLVYHDFARMHKGLGLKTPQIQARWKERKARLATREEEVAA